ncbi:MAG TPA: hypothetical protein VEX43_03430 [Chthoniobacterales bacterium]|nr:hypothetical protein [Chthoniobacterales bacterium]
MNPEKLFDYLEGKLSETERTQLEERLAADPQLQRELAIAREMHRRSRGSREVLLEDEEPEIPSPAKPLGRRLITAFAALVLLNVLVGIAFIIGKKGDRTGEREAATRQQLTESLQRTAETALPLPTIADDIFLPALVDERERMADSVILLATQAGGSAAKAPPDEKRITVIVDLPSTRADEFRRSLAPLAPADYSPPPPDPSAAPDKRAIMQVRIGEPLPSPTP